MGLELFSPDDDSSAVVTAVRAPDGIDGTELLRHLRDRHGVTLAPGQGDLKGKIFRHRPHRLVRRVRHRSRARGRRALVDRARRGDRARRRGLAGVRGLRVACPRLTRARPRRRDVAGAGAARLLVPRPGGGRREHPRVLRRGRRPPRTRRARPAAGSSRSSSRSSSSATASTRSRSSPATGGRTRRRSPPRSARRSARVARGGRGASPRPASTRARSRRSRPTWRRCDGAELLQHGVVWVGAGSPAHMAALSPVDLERLARARTADLVTRR